MSLFAPIYDKEVHPITIIGKLIMVLVLTMTWIGYRLDIERLNEIFDMNKI